MRFTARELAACNIIQFVAISSPRCQAALRLPSTFQTFLDMLEVGIESLIMRAVELEASLSNLDERLNTIRDISIGEAKVHLSEKEQILAGVWAQFGANQQRVFLLDHNLQVLEMIHHHRRSADSCVSNIESELQAMKASLEYLRPLAASMLLYGVGPSAEFVAQQIKAGAEWLSKQVARDLEMEMAGYDISIRNRLSSSDISYPEA